MVGGLHISMNYVRGAILKYSSLKECLEAQRKRVLLRIDYDILEFVPDLPKYRVNFIRTGISIFYGCLIFTKDVKEEIFLKVLETCASWVSSIEIMFDIIPSKTPFEPAFEMPLLKSIDMCSYRKHIPYCLLNIIEINAPNISFIRVPWQCLPFKLNFNPQCDIKGINVYLNVDFESSCAFFWYSRFIFDKNIRHLIASMIVKNVDEGPVKKKMKM